MHSPSHISVQVERKGAHGITQITICDGGSTAEEVVQMVREAMVAIGFSPRLVACVQYVGQTVTDESYGGH